MQNHDLAPEVTLALKKFMSIESSPPEWRGLDLYLFRDETVVFYVGQSHLVFDRVWNVSSHYFGDCVAKHRPEGVER